MKVLIVSNQNATRSIMAEAFLKSFNRNLKVYSAGLSPATAIAPETVKVMQEVGIDVQSYKPRSIRDFYDENLDYYISITPDAISCMSNFTGRIENNLYILINTPKAFPQDDLNIFRSLREEIKDEFERFYMAHLQ